MCDKEGKSIENFHTNWCTYYPKILELGESLPVQYPEYKPIQILDKKLRSGGIVAKAPAVFSIYPVSVIIMYKYST